MAQKRLKKEEVDEAENDGEEFDDESLEEEIADEDGDEEEIEEADEKDRLKNFERFMSEGRIVKIMPNASEVLKSDEPVENLEHLNVNTGRKEINENGNIIQYVSPVSEDENKKYSINNEGRLRQRTEVSNFDFGAPEITRGSELERVRPEKTFLDRELESGGSNFKGDYDLEKEYMPVDDDSFKPKKRLPWQR